MLIIKKDPAPILDKDIAKIFRNHNVIEYRSPEEHLSVSDYYSVISRACTYHESKGVPFDDITVTFIKTRYSWELFDFLAMQRNYRIKETSPGIYLIEGEVFPVQIIVIDKLKGPDNVWLRSLNNNLPASSLEELLEAKKEFSDGDNMYTYMSTILNANADAVKDIKPEHKSDLVNVLNEMGYIDEWRQHGINDTLSVIKGLKNNIPIDQLADKYKMPAEVIDRIKAEL
ncbi:MAG: hypothetical protein LBS62_06165 [Clostridiales bacterium]|jgi:hypothetical protein|nr:hypothetical protein [Clostridiales bacterium]